MHQKIVTKIEWDNKCKVPNVLVNALINKINLSPEYTAEAAVLDFPQIQENINCSSLFGDSRF